jgi:galactofuranosylgalactofuranosylrhamnosyl-N-acetylglucosaminyl-diphospho-decaprenol beta-1,5/1,6-galactofuranosyltransferase
MIYVLQDLVLDAPPGLEALYWRNGEPASSGRDVALSVAAGGALSLSTFANSFYERYWRDLGGLRSLGLRLQLSGPSKVRIVRSRPGVEPVVLLEQSSDGPNNRLQLAIDLDTLPLADAVIHAEIIAEGATAILHGGAWETDQPPRSPVGLALVYCSYGREAPLAESLHRIAAIVAATPAILTVTVVDQKQSLSEVPQIAAIVSANAFGGKLRIVPQDNFGGSGGFTRGIIEAHDGGATHVALLDDDTAIDPNVLVRLCRLLSYAESNVTIGGQMLNARFPTLLSASHEAVDLERFKLRNPLSASALAVPGAALLFAARHTSGYNGWWLCCIPLAVIATLGLPLPMFIRHDDTEYGTRCTLAGAPVVAMPGIFVWHEPFEAGRSPWIGYYDRRNMMIAAAVHGCFRLRSALAWFWSEASWGLALDHFGLVAANCLAVEDYLKGPAFVFARPQLRHRELQLQHARYSLLAALLRRSRGTGVTTAIPSKAARALALLKFCSDAIYGGKPAARTARAILRLHARTILAALHLVISHRRLAAEYRSSAAYYSSMAFWRGYLNLNR